MTKSKVVWVLYIGLALELIILIVSGYQTDNLTTFFQSCARYSGRVSLLLFSIAFIFYPVNRLSAETESIQRKLVLYFAIVHLIHFGFLATYIYLSQSVLIPARLAGGAFAYLLIIAYPIIQSVKPSAGFWNYFPLLYYYYVWLVFFLSYLPRIRQQLPDVSGDLETYYFLFVYVIILLLFQLFLMRKNLKQHK